MSVEEEEAANAAAATSASSIAKKPTPSKSHSRDRIPAEVRFHRSQPFKPEFDRGRVQLFILVRPPPTLNNHPLNIQIQLITPQPTVASTSRRASVDLSVRPETPASGQSAIANATVEGGQPTYGASLSRTPSVRSNRSVVSSAGSAASTTGTTSTRRVTPLYNLNVHTVLLSTTVSDAGTDAKIAKFGKKGIEINDFAVLEASELSPSGKKLAPEVSPPTVMVDEARQPPATAGPVEKAGLMNKLKRFSFPKGKAPATPTVTAPSSTTAHEPNGLGLFRTRTGDPAAVVEATGTATTVQPHAAGYVWSVAKWSSADLAGREADVSFEWKKRRRSSRKASERRRHSTYRSEDGTTTSGLSPPRANRKSVDLSRTPSRPTTATDHLMPPGARTPESERGSPILDNGSFKMGEGDSTDDESDPEDSESPWVADVVAPNGRTTLATLSPAPFHPKLVAQLAVVATLSPIKISDEAAISVEDLKDFVACTALWLVVRESLGGIAKKRKGDGKLRI